MLWDAMRTPPGVRSVLLAISVAVVASGCGGNSWSLRQFFGLPRVNDPTVSLRATETKWLLIRNPRYGDVPSEPEYVWVEEDKVPTTMKSLMFGKSTLLAPPDIVAKYGAPPGGGRISTRQGGAYKVENTVPTVPTNSRGPVASVPGTTRTDAAGGVGAQPSTRGYVVFVDTSRVVIDLAAPDGVKIGTNVSVRRDKIAIVHPITGELLGELDEEVATGRVVEVRDKFSVVEVQKAAAGAQVQVKDRVVLR
jgi:hypothetical protein